MKILARDVADVGILSVFLKNIDIDTYLENKNRYSLLVAFIEY